MGREFEPVRSGPQAPDPGSRKGPAPWSGGGALTIAGRLLLRGCAGRRGAGRAAALLLVMMLLRRGRGRGRARRGRGRRGRRRRRRVGKRRTDQGDGGQSGNQVLELHRCSLRIKRVSALRAARVPDRLMGILTEGSRGRMLISRAGSQGAKARVLCRESPPREPYDRKVMLRPDLLAGP